MFERRPPSSGRPAALDLDNDDFPARHERRWYPPTARMRMQASRRGTAMCGFVEGAMVMRCGRFGSVRKMGCS